MKFYSNFLTSPTKFVGQPGQARPGEGQAEQIDRGAGLNDFCVFFLFQIYRYLFFDFPFPPLPFLQLSPPFFFLSLESFRWVFGYVRATPGKEIHDR